MNHFLMVHLIGTNYCGLLNKDGLVPVNALDQACFDHDHAGDYQSWIDYFRARPSDYKFLDDIKYVQGPGAKLARSFFKTKIAMTSRDGLGGRLPSNFEDPDIDYAYERRARARKKKIDYERRRKWFQQLEEMANAYKQGLRRRRRNMAKPFILGAKRRYRRRRKSFGKMPKRRRTYGRRRYNKRRRRYYRRRGYRYNRYRDARLAHRVINALEPPRSYIIEEDHALVLGSGNSYFWAPSSFLGNTEIETAWKATGQGNNPLFASSPSETQRGHLLQASARWEFTNNNLFPIYIKVYWLLPKGKTYSANTVEEFAMARFHEGVESRTSDTGDAYVSVSGKTVFTRIMSLNPKDSPTLRDHFYIKPGKAGKLQSGDVANFRWKRKKPKTISYEEIFDDDSYKAKPGLTVIPVFKIQAALGHDITTNTTQGTLSGVVNMRSFKRHTWKKSSGHLSLLAVGGVTNNTGSFENPTPDLMKED
jgi:hypothetical protein